MLAATAVSLGALLFIIGTLIRSIRNERTPGRSVWREFGLGMALMILFFGTWIAHGAVEWQTYTDQQREHGQPTEAGDFLAEFGQSTLENWQSEFLQLFAFVVLAALYIHKGSAESRDGDDKLEASLRRIEEKLGTLPEPSSRSTSADGWKLPDAPVETG
jgi:hypothetical protein